MPRLSLAHPARTAWLALGALAAAFILWRLAVWFWAADTIAVIASVALTAVFLLFVAAPVVDRASGDSDGVPPCLALLAAQWDRGETGDTLVHAASLCSACPGDYECPRLERARGSA